MKVDDLVELLNVYWALAQVARIEAMEVDFCLGYWMGSKLKISRFLNKL